MTTTFSPQTTAARRAAAPVIRAGYARISIEEARTGGHSIARQIDSMRRADPAMEVFVDDGISGTKTSRPGLDALLRYVEQEKVTEIVVARLDRLGRNHDLKNLLPDLFHDKGCRVVCTEEDSPDLATDMGRMMFDIKCNVNCSESDRISRRVQAARTNLFHKVRHMTATSGYLLIDGKLVPDDMPRHCPLAQRREVEGEPDQWGIASDAWVGLSNFEITAMPIKVALRLRSWTAGKQYADRHLLLTRSGAWDLARNCYAEYTANNQVEEILVVDGTPVKAARLLQSVVPQSGAAIRVRANNHTFYGNFYARRNWDPDRRPSLNKRRSNYGFIDTDTYEFFVPGTHAPMLSDEDFKTIVQWNTEIRRAAEAGLRPATYACATGQNVLDKTPAEVLTNHTLKLLASKAHCLDCGQKMNQHTTYYYQKKQRYHYLRCVNNMCPSYLRMGRLDTIVAGVTLALAEEAARIQSGEAIMPSVNGAELLAIKEREEHRDGLLVALQHSPKNQVLRNELKKAEAKLDALRNPAATASSLEGLKVHQRFRHPRALEPGAWLELLSMNAETMVETLMPIKRINLGWTAGVKPKRGPTPKHSVRVESIELFEQF